MARASCWLLSGLGVGGATHAVEGPHEAYEYATEARILDSGDAIAEALAISRSVQVSSLGLFRPHFSNSVVPTCVFQTATRDTSESCGSRPSPELHQC